MANWAVGYEQTSTDEALSILSTETFMGSDLALDDRLIARTLYSCAKTDLRC